MSFNAEEFTKNPSLVTLLTLKNSKLLSLATHYKLEIDTSARKADVQKALSDHLVDEDLVSGDREESSPELIGVPRTRKVA